MFTVKLSIQGGNGYKGFFDSNVEKGERREQYFRRLEWPLDVGAVDLGQQLVQGVCNS